MRVPAGLVAACLLLVGCSSPAETPGPGGSSAPGPPPPTASAPSASSPTLEAGPTPRPRAARRIDVSTALDTVRQLAGVVGPRPATSPAYRRAAGWVERRLVALGYVVRRQRVPVPGGVSWGVPVPPGTADTLVATAPGTSLRRPHLIVGAHLDTVPQAPGGEDNASGVAVLLAVAEAVSDRPTRLPVVLVAFAAEEPRGPTDDDHHYGSRRYVALLRPPQRAAVRGMLSLDRVGVGRRVPVCAARSLDEPGPASVLRAGRRAGVPVQACLNASSDHWSFVRAGLPGVRVGGTSYAEYHTAADGPAVPRPAQLARTGRVVLAWLARRG